MGEINDDDLDDILDSALDDLNHDKGKAPAPAQAQGLPAASKPAEIIQAGFDSNMPPPESIVDPNMIPNFQDPEFQKELLSYSELLGPNMREEMEKMMSMPNFIEEMKMMQNLLKDLSVQQQQEQNAGANPSSSASSSFAQNSSSSASKASSSGSLSSSSQQTKPKEKEQTNKFQNSVSGTLNKLRESEEQVKSEVNAEAVNGDMLSNLMQSLSQGGEGAGMEALMETMMQQLLAKEVLYEPMKEMDTLYPQWLAESKVTLSEADFTRCSEQARITHLIVQAYEKTEGKTPYEEILQLMQQLQAYGQPPAELLKRMAPGLEIGENGLPKIPGMSDDGCPVM